MSLSLKVENTYKNQECKITSDYEILRKSPIFKDAAPEVTKLFAYLAKRKIYSPGELIISADKQADMAFYIISGSADVTTLHKDREIVLQRLKPKTFFGELALLGSFKWFFNVQPVEDCEVLLISRKSFQKVLQSFPDKRDKMIEKIVQLRVKRFVEQTNYMLDKLPDSYLDLSIWSPVESSM